MFRACISEFGYQGCVCTLVSGSGEDWEWCGPSLGQKGVTEDDMVGWHHWQCTVSFSKLQGSQVCCSSWGCRVGHDLATEQQFSWSCPRDPLINLGLALIHVSLETWLLSHIEKKKRQLLESPDSLFLDWTQQEIVFPPVLTLSLFPWSEFCPWPSSASSQIWIQSLFSRPTSHPQLEKGLDGLPSPPLHVFLSSLKIEPPSLLRELTFELSCP